MGCPALHVIDRMYVKLQTKCTNLTSSNLSSLLITLIILLTQSKSEYGGGHIVKEIRQIETFLQFFF